jgi:hypothetical protein
MMDDGVILTAVRVLLPQETSDQHGGGIAYAQGEGALQKARTFNFCSHGASFQPLVRQ